MEGPPNQVQDPSASTVTIISERVKSAMKTALEEQQQRGQQQEKMELNPYRLPLNRIKKIVKSDTDVRMIGQDVPALFSKACELFLAHFIVEGWAHTETTHHRVLQIEDISKTVDANPQFDFLRDVVPLGNKQMKRSPICEAQVLAETIPEAAPKKQKPISVSVEENFKFLPEDINQLLFKNPVLMPELLPKPATQVIRQVIPEFSAEPTALLPLMYQLQQTQQEKIRSNEAQTQESSLSIPNSTPSVTFTPPIFLDTLEPDETPTN